VDLKEVTKSHLKWPIQCPTAQHVRILPGDGTVMRIDLKRDIHINLLLTELDMTRAKEGHASTTKDGVRTLVTEFETHLKRSRVMEIWCFGAIVNGGARVVVPNSALASKTDVNFTSFDHSEYLRISDTHCCTLCTELAQKIHRERPKKYLGSFANNNELRGLFFSPLLFCIMLVTELVSTM
jgi:hypothetical protein